VSMVVVIDSCSKALLDVREGHADGNEPADVGVP
jgi:hypothetical protein